MSAAGVRSTRQRAAISTLLETLDDFRSAQELHDELRRRGENHEVEAWAAEVATKHGFSDVSHTIEIFGTCSDCRS